MGEEGKKKKKTNEKQRSYVSITFFFCFQLSLMEMIPLAFMKLEAF